MVKALLVKELKESSWIWLLAAAAYAVLTLDVMRVPLLTGFVRQFTMGPFASDEIPFVNAQVAQGLGWITGSFAVGLGIWQSFGESWRGTFPLLLHMPISRRRLFAWKLSVGLTLTLGLAGLALAAMCVWAATPGTHASPFEWDMTGFSWRVWFVGPLLYLGGFTTGLYPARWLGTRLFPLLIAAVIGAMLLIVSEVTQMLPGWVFVPAIVVAEGAFLVAIGHLIQTRDFA